MKDSRSKIKKSLNIFKKDCRKILERRQRSKKQKKENRKLNFTADPPQKKPNSLQTINDAKKKLN